jgi:hypothetical protein
MGLKVDPAERCKASPNSLSQIWGGAVIVLFEDIIENRAEFRLHRLSVARGAHP